MKKLLIAFILTIFNTLAYSQQRSAGSSDHVLMNKPLYAPIVWVDGKVLSSEEYKNVKSALMIHEYLFCEGRNFLNDYFKCENNVNKNDIFFIFTKKNVDDISKREFLTISQKERCLYKVNDDPLSTDIPMLNKIHNLTFLSIKMVKKIQFKNLTTDKTDTFNLIIVRNRKK